MTRADLSPVQQKAMDFIESDIGLVFDHNRENLQLLAAHLGMKQPASVRNVLFNLRGKGFLVSEGNLESRPARWQVVSATERHRVAGTLA